GALEIRRFMAMPARAERKVMRECEHAALAIRLEVLFEPIELRRRRLAFPAVERDQAPGLDLAARELLGCGKIQCVISRLRASRRAVLQDHLSVVLLEIGEIGRSVSMTLTCWPQLL